MERKKKTKEGEKINVVKSNEAVIENRGNREGTKE